MPRGPRIVGFTARFPAGQLSGKTLDAGLKVGNQTLSFSTIQRIEPEVRDGAIATRAAVLTLDGKTVKGQVKDLNRFRWIWRRDTAMRFVQGHADRGHAAGGAGFVSGV